MADSGGDFFLERDNLDISQLIRLQSAIRGTLVRNWMKEVRQAFEETFNELEKNPALSVDWRSDSLCSPKVIRTRDKLKNEKKNKTSILNSYKGHQLENSEASRHDTKQQTNVTAEKDLKTCESETVSEISDALRESPKFNSVEIQTSFIDVNYQHVPKDLEYDSDRVNEEDNKILDDLDTSWKDRVEPFLRNNFCKTENEGDFAKPISVENELHLDLKADRESIDTDRSGKRSSRSSARDVNSVKDKEEFKRKETSNHEKISKASGVERKAVKSDRSRSSTGQRFDHEDEPRYKGQRSSHSEDRSSRSHRKEIDERSARTPKEFDRDSQISDRSNRSRERGQHLNETEGFSPRGQRSNLSQYSDSRSQKSQRSENRSGQLSHRSDRSEERRQNSQRSQDERSARLDGAQSHRSDRIKSYRSEDAKSHRFDGYRSHRSEDAKSYRSEGAQSCRTDDAKSHRSDGYRSHRSENAKSCRSDGGHSHRSEDAKSHRSDSSEGRQSQKSDRSQRSKRDEGQRSERNHYEETMLPSESRASPVPSKMSAQNNLQGDNSREGRPPIQDSTTLTNVTSVWDSFNSMRDSCDVDMPKALPQDAGQLKELRKNIAMELLWVQQAIDSRKNYLKLKGQM